MVSMSEIKLVIPDEAVEAAARAIAILDDHDGCFLEVDAWNAQEEWEREAHPESYPGSAVEGCAYWLARAHASLEAAAPHLMARSSDGDLILGILESAGIEKVHQFDALVAVQKLAAREGAK
jgi:hypothetical protein